jgi:hypothetical protein
MRHRHPSPNWKRAVEADSWVAAGVLLAAVMIMATMVAEALAR